MAEIYDHEAGFEEPNNKNAWFGRIIGSQRRILEVGCAAGYVGEYLVQKQQCCVYGIEYIEKAAAEARRRGCYESIIVGDIQNPETVAALEPCSFDFILFGDVLEHLISPERALEIVAPRLKPEGHVLICVPSIVHWSIRRDILRGRFEYTETGPLDRTHIHFFTPKTARDLVRQGGFQIAQEGGVVRLPPFVYKSPPRIRRRLEDFSARLWPNAVYGQVLLDAVRKAS